MRQLPIVADVDVSHDAIVRKALSDRGIDRAIYDFIRHNLGEAAALVAILTAEPRK